MRAFDSTLPERTIIVNYDGFAEGNNLWKISFIKETIVISVSSCTAYCAFVLLIC